jgi:hypothetical protein
MVFDGLHWDYFRTLGVRYCFPACFQIRFLRFFLELFSWSSCISRQLDLACNQCASSTGVFFIRFDSGRGLFQRELAARICSRFQPFFLIYHEYFSIVRSICCARTCVRLGHCTPFLLLMRYNFLKRILLGTLGVEYSS